MLFPYPLSFRKRLFTSSCTVSLAVGQSRLITLHYLFMFCHIWKFALVPASVCCSWYICLRFFLWIVSDVILHQYWRFDFVNDKGVKANDSLFDWSIRPMWHSLRQTKCSNCILERKYLSHNSNWRAVSYHRRYVSNTKKKEIRKKSNTINNNNMNIQHKNTCTTVLQ